MLYYGNKKDSCLSLFTDDGHMGFSIEHPGYTFIYFTSVWTAILLQSAIKARPTVYCQQSTLRSQCSHSLCNSGTRLSPRKQSITLHTESWIQFLKIQILFNKIQSICGFPSAIVYHSYVWKESKIIFRPHFLRGKTFLQVSLGESI